MERRREVLRPLDQVERYFWLLDHVTPTNVTVVAHCDRLLDPDQLRVGLRQLQLRHPLLGACVVPVDSDPVFEVTDHPLDLTVMAPGESWQTWVERTSDTLLEREPGPLFRAAYCPSPRGDKSLLLVGASHAISDGRSLTRLVQHLLRWVDRGEAALPPPEPVPSELPERFPEAIASARAVAEVLGAVREERADLEASAGLPFHDPMASGRDSRLEVITLDAPACDRLLGAARAAGATAGTMVAAATLRAAADGFDDSADRTLTLTTATDLARRVEPPVPTESMRVAVGLLATPYRVRHDEGVDALAARIAAQLQKELGRYESHLFYRMARLAAYEATDDGIASFDRWVRSLPQNVTASNLGVVDHRDDPEWLRSLAFALPPAPNQAAFVATTSYRSETLLLCMTDGAKFPDQAAHQFVARLADRVGGTTS